MDDKYTMNAIPEQQPEHKPNEQVGFHFSSSLKITDPDSGVVLLNVRAD